MNKKSITNYKKANNILVKVLSPITKIYLSQDILIFTYGNKVLVNR